MLTPPPMSNAPFADALRRFAHDLGALREARGVSLDQLQQASRIPVHVLRDFEADALLANPVFNRVYLRSLVKTYADSLRITAPSLLTALEEAYAGTYTALGAEDAPAAAAPDGPVPVGTAAPVGTGARTQVPTPDPVAAPKSPRVTLPTATTHGMPPAPGRTGPVQPPASAAEVEATGPPAPRVAVPLTAPDPVGEAFTNAAYDNRYEPRRLPSWVPVLAGVVGLLAVIAGIVWWLGRSEEPAPAVPVASTTTLPAPADTARAAAPRPAASPTAIAFRDTNTLVLRAGTGALRGVRVRVDADARRPYWLEAGTERAFSFRDSIFVYRPISGAVLTVNGAAVDTTALAGADGTVRIVRGSR